MLTTSEVYDDAALTALVAAATLLGADLKMGLYTNVIAPTKTLVIADMVEPAYAGYARQVVVMGAPFRDPVNGIQAQSIGLTWQEAGAITPVIIQGVFFITGAGPSFMGIAPFDAPIALNDALDAFTVILQYIQSSQNQGLQVVVR